MPDADADADAVGGGLGCGRSCDADRQVVSVARPAQRAVDRSTNGSEGLMERPQHIA